MIRKIASVSVIALALSMTSAISSVDAQTIEDAMAKAYINNPTLLAARAGLQLSTRVFHRLWPIGALRSKLRHQLARKYNEGIRTEIIDLRVVVLLISVFP